MNKKKNRQIILQVIKEVNSEKKIVLSPQTTERLLRPFDYKGRYPFSKKIACG